MNDADQPNTSGNGNGRKYKEKIGHGGKTVRAAGPDQLNHRELLAALRAFKRGNFDIKIREDLSGIDGCLRTFTQLLNSASKPTADLQIRGNHSAVGT